MESELMNPFVNHTGLVATLDRVNVDTDQIIPKQFLKRIERTGFGQFLFFDWRFNQDGELNEEFELNQTRFEGATILLARANFGCGSSREHAPWALADFGFKVILAPSFADIFYNNCFKNGMLPIRLSEGQIDDLFTRVRNTPGYKLSVDLERRVIEDEQGLSISFTVAEFARECLLKGLDDIGLTLEHAERITEFEKKRVSFR
jgi:3-isopropylmalate/(R)-2-methylmalate dehydratase small subunit